MSTEHVMWGLPKGSTERFDEVLLLSNAGNMQIVEQVKRLAGADGFHSFRIAVIDFSSSPDFAGTVR